MRVGQPISGAGSFRPGQGWFGKTLNRLEQWLDKRGHAALADLRGIALASLRQPVPSTPLDFLFDRQECSRCQKCVIVCAYGARHLSSEGDMFLDPALCRSCGLCLSVCPTEALRSR
jgi:dihydroorotate dehydrogenase (fumarate)